MLSYRSVKEANSRPNTTWSNETIAVPRLLMLSSFIVALRNFSAVCLAISWWRSDGRRNGIVYPKTVASFGLIYQIAAILNLEVRQHSALYLQTDVSIVSRSLWLLFYVPWSEDHGVKCVSFTTANATYSSITRRVSSNPHVKKFCCRGQH